MKKKKPISAKDKKLEKIIDNQDLIMNGILRLLCELPERQRDKDLENKIAHEGLGWW